jgi:hypothetical protein
VSPLSRSTSLSLLSGPQTARTSTANDVRKTFRLGINKQKSACINTTIHYNVEILPINNAGRNLAHTSHSSMLMAIAASSGLQNLTSALTPQLLSPEHVMSESVASIPLQDSRPLQLIVELVDVTCCVDRCHGKRRQQVVTHTHSRARPKRQHCAATPGAHCA